SVNASRTAVPELLLAVWLSSTFLLLVPSFLPGPGWAARYFAALALSGGAAATYALWCSNQLARIGPVPTGTAEAWNLLEQARGYESLFWGSMLVMLALILVSALGWCGLAPLQVRRPTIAGLLAGFGVVVIVFAIAIYVSTVRAAGSLRWAGILPSQKVWPASQQVFERAIQLKPTEFVYRSRLAKALRDQGETARDEATSSRLIKQAEETLQATKGLP